MTVIAAAYVLFIFSIIMLHKVMCMHVKCTSSATRCLTHRSIIASSHSHTYNTKSSSIRLYSAASSSIEVDSVVAKIVEKSTFIRTLKATNKDDPAIKVEVTNLLQLKETYQELTGNSYDPPSSKPVTKKSKSSGDNQKKDNNAGNKGKDASGGLSDQESLVITPRLVDYSAWYTDVISAADLVDQSPVRGCMVIKPWGMAIWDLLHKDLDERIKETGTDNAYFPLFIPKSFLAKEAQHVEGFAKECAVVTHHRLCASPDGKDLIPDPDAVLEEPLIVRPTSETVIWNMFGKWIRSYRDLPLKINQWANVVRWEMRTRPFLRSAEFLWQEGHTAHATADDAIKTARESLEMYSSVCEELLAVPCVKGMKSPSERFAGADETYTIEALMQNGWALQSGTSHFLGQSFARAFDVFYQTENGDRELVWATSWGVSTRLIGALVMTHSDDKGLVLPPNIAPVQVVIVPISKGSGEEHDEIMLKVNEIVTKLKKDHKIRVKVDERYELRPGAKFFHWERKGVPIRLEIGPKDVASGHVVSAARHTGDKKQIKTTDMIEFGNNIKKDLDLIQSDLLIIAKNRLADKTFPVTTYADMKRRIELGAGDDKGQAGFYLVPWKCDAANEAAIKEDSKATIRCYPFEHNKHAPADGIKCFYSGEQATHMALFARAF